MTLAELIPGRKGTGSRRAVDKVAELRDENRKLLTRQMAADDFFALLMQDRDEVYAAWERTEQKRQEAETVAAAMRSERDELLEECAEWRVEAQALHARLAPYLAAEANAHKVSVPAMERPVDGPEDEATTPIDVRPLWDALGTEPTVAVTDPGHVPSWAVRDADTVPVPVVRVEPAT